MHRCIYLTFCCLSFFAISLWPEGSFAQWRPFLSPVRDSQFQTPPGLRARVDFWKEIFSKYGKNEVVIHHREYPQLVFTTLDFSAQAASLNPVALDSLKKREVEARIDEVKQALKRLASGATPATELEERIVSQMQGLNGGSSKYQRMLDEDLVRSQTGIKEKAAEAIRRSGRYLPIMEKIFVQDYGLPVEITRLPFVESSFDYQAYSSVGAAGIWQFMPKTARLYMTVNNLVDERRDPIESSQAAARYLASAYQRIGTWPLTITSYNHGVAGVMSKVRKIGTTDIVTLIESQNDEERAFGFASSNFFPSFMAAVELYDERQVYYPDVEVEPVLRIAKVRLPFPVKVSEVSRQLGCSIEVLKESNYAIADSVWQGRYPIPGGYVLKVPAEYADRLSDLRLPEARLEESAIAPTSVYGGVVHHVKKGESLAAIARKYTVPIDQIKRLNSLRSGEIKVGQNLVIKLREQPKAVKKKSEEKPKERETTIKLPKTTPTPLKKAAAPIATPTALPVKKVSPPEIRATKPTPVIAPVIKKAEPVRVEKAPVVAPTPKPSLVPPSAKPAAPAAQKKGGGYDVPVPLEVPEISAPVARPRSYQVRPGDTIFSLARKFGVSAEDIKRENKLQSNSIHVGKVLQIPRSEEDLWSKKPAR